MEYRTFGRSGLAVSVVGLGGGGASRLGLVKGSSEAGAVAVVRRALDLGINYIDTADNYGTERVIGRAIAGRREEVLLSTKVYPRRVDGTMIDAAALRRALDASLAAFGVDTVDVYHLHGVDPAGYDYCVAELVPELEAARRAGKVRFVGITENNSNDPSHETLARATADGCWDMAMVGFNLFNQSARVKVLPQAERQGIGIEIMASARTQFSQPALFAEDIARLRDEGQIDERVDPADPFAFLAGMGDGASLAEVSYRFALGQTGVHTVLVGTGSIEHLEEDVRAFAAGPLSGELQERLIGLFGHLARAVSVPGRTGR